MTEKQKAVHTIPFKQWLKEQIPAGMSDIQLPYIEEHLQGKTFTRSYSRKEGEEIRYVYDMTPVGYVRAWVREVHKDNKRLLEYGLQVCDDFEKGLLQVYDLPGKLRGYIEDYMEEVCIEDSPLDNPVWYMSSLLSYSLRFKVAAAVAEDGIKEDVTPTEFCLWARAMNLYINASGAALIETREAILQVIQEADDVKLNAEKKDALLEVLTSIQYSALALARRALIDEIHCNIDMLHLYCSTCLADLVKAEEAQEGRCMRCYDRCEDLALAGGEILCPACFAEKQ